MQKVITVFNADEDLTDVFGEISNEGITEDAIGGPYPATYLEQSTIARKYATIIPVTPTSIESDVYLLHVFHVDGVTTAETMRDEAADREQTIVNFIEENSASRTWENDGDQGFKVECVTTQWYIVPNAAVAAFRILMRFGAYGP